MNVLGRVISIDMNATIAKNGGGSYQGAELIYKDKKDGKAVTKGFHQNSLKYNAALKNALEDLEAGDEFTMEMEKEGEFWNVKKLYKGIAAQPAQTIQASKLGGTTGGPSSTYSTKEERDQTQVYIVRQSSITNALKLAEVQGNKKVSIEEVLDTAKQLEDFVFGRHKQAHVNFNEGFDDELPE